MQISLAAANNWKKVNLLFVFPSKCFHKVTSFAEKRNIFAKRNRWKHKHLQNKFVKLIFSLQSIFCVNASREYQSKYIICWDVNHHVYASMWVNERRKVESFHYWTAFELFLRYETFVDVFNFSCLKSALTTSSPADRLRAFQRTYLLSITSTVSESFDDMNGNSLNWRNKK